MKYYDMTIPEIELKFRSGNVLHANIASPDDAYGVFMKFFDQDTIELNESVVVLFMNTANDTMAWMKLSSGGISSSIVDVRLLFSTALKCAASGFILAHNHPSGKLVPSEADIQLTRKILQASKFLDIKLLDHMIVTTKGYYSFKNEGIM